MSLLQKVIQWLTSHFRQDPQASAPRGWYIRGLFVLVVFSIPAALWVLSLSEENRGLRHSWAFQVCPPVGAISLSELLHHPQRFRHKDIWVMGRLEVVERKCMRLPCAKTQGKCCHPCVAQLQLRHGSHRLRLRGLLRDSSSRPQAVWCRDDTCQRHCRPFSPGKIYAFAGRPLVQTRFAPKTGQPRFRVQALFAHQYCTARSIVDPRRPPEPRFKK